MSYLSREEVKKQNSILEFYEAFDMDDFGKIIFNSLKSEGLAGGRIKFADNERDFMLTLVYDEADGKTTKEEGHFNVFDFFGSFRHSYKLRFLLRKYFEKKFGNEYLNIYKDYEDYKFKKGVNKYVKSEELLLSPWN